MKQPTTECGNFKIPTTKGVTLRKTGGLLLALTLASAAFVIFAPDAGAWHPVISGTVERDCGANAPWTGTVTATSDKDYDSDWQNKYKVTGGSYSTYSALVDDQTPFVVNVGPFPASQADVTVYITSRWEKKGESTKQLDTKEGSVKLTRPATTECPPPKPEDKTEYSEWTDSKFTCGDESVTQTRTKTTTSYTYDKQTNTWVPTASSIVIETQTRPLADQEKEGCLPSEDCTGDPTKDPSGCPIDDCNLPGGKPAECDPPGPTPVPAPPTYMG